METYKFIIKKKADIVMSIVAMETLNCTIILGLDHSSMRRIK